MATVGEQLLQIADDSWNSRRGEYHGGKFNAAVLRAMQQDAATNGTQGRRRKVRREEAVKVVTALFNRTRHRAAQDLTEIAEQAKPREVGSNAVATAANDKLQEFAAEVMEELNGVEEANDGPPLRGVVDPAMIIGLIQAIIAAVQMCRTPAVTV